MKPNLSRRSFLKSVGNAAIAGAATSLPALAAPVRALTHGRRLSLCILHETSFPTLNTLPIHGELIQKAFADCEIHFISAAEFVQSDALNHCDVLVTPYGSAFPKDCFLRLSAFLNEGGNWLNLGGTPLLVPVSRKNGSWVPEVPQPAYGKKLGILHSFPVDVPSLPGFLASAHFPEAAGLEKECVVKEAFELYVRFTSKKDHPDEDGSDGPREAKLSPIMRLIDAAGRPVAAPFVCIDRLKGKYSGGRWVFAAMNGELTSHAIRCLADIAAESAFEFGVNASYACYREGETPSFSIYCRRPKGMLEEILPEPAHVQIFSEARVLLGEGEIPMQGIGSSKAGSGAIAMKKKRALPPGLYHVRAAVFYRSPVTGAKQTAAAENGFWIYDEKLIAAGAPLTTDAHSFYRNGKPFPITGTTYMASDVHRKFLFEPNPHVWDADFRDMKLAGVNVVRTGIWTGYRDYMPKPGVMAESPLRALDAYILNAKKHDIPVIFTMFAFLPEAWGGKNPFLDPAAIAAQKEFVRAITTRYPQVDDLMWDLINEPSFSSPSQLWSVRPNYDGYEAEAWEQWVAARHPASSAGERNALLQELWHTTPEDSLGLPQLSEFEDAHIFNERRPYKALDYRLFAQEKFSAWIGEISGAIRSNGNPHQLITVGQDEGGTYERPNQHFHEADVSFTCLHNWWLNDDLLWDSVMTKTLLRPNLAEETGLMFYERMDGSSWRTETEARNLLERKLAISIGAGGAGFIQWIWNTNCYMTLDNEAAIGFYRVAGTAKPELESFTKFSKFLNQHSDAFVGRKDEEVVMVIPHSAMYSVRDQATPATKRLVRTMGYHCRIAVRGVSEYALDKLSSPPSLIVLPGAGSLTSNAWHQLMRLVDAGSVLLVTGWIEEDEYGRPANRMSGFGVEISFKPIAQEEWISIGGKQFCLGYRGEKMQRIGKASLHAIETPDVQLFRHGKGSILWMPVPIELSESVEAAAALYDYAASFCRIVPSFVLDKEDPSILLLPTRYQGAALYAIVSESSRDTHISFRHGTSEKRIEVDLPAQRAALCLIDAATGAKIADTLTS